MPAGRFTGLIGPNGSGKSTLLRLLAGLLRPRAGTVLLDGRRLGELPRREVARRLAVVAQEVSTDIDMTVADVVALGRIPHRSPLALIGRDDLRDARETEEALERCGLAGWGGRRWSTLSGGERRRVGIARALAQRPTELLLDEPTNHLDIHHQLDLLRMLSRAPATVVAALHDLNLAARYCDHLLLLEAGRLVASGPPRRGPDRTLDRARLPGTGHTEPVPRRPHPAVVLPAGREGLPTLRRSRPGRGTMRTIPPGDR
ncbi:ABC transporter ATP-binding protein [Streptosporangium vulgare]|uniref:ABC transporter ATP-binding protein n=1 Tax=Streptosporangium vulgare TaxID=46190 RepID=UPI0031D5CFE9